VRRDATEQLERQPAGKPARATTAGSHTDGPTAAPCGMRGSSSTKTVTRLVAVGERARNVTARGAPWNKSRARVGAASGPLSAAKGVASRRLAVVSKAGGPAKAMR
jgi:hypothetical protein